MADDEKSVEITEVDDNKIDEAVAKINDMAQETVFKGSIAIGDYVLDTFFKGDINLAASKNPKKQASFNKLCERKDLLIPPNQLALMVRVASQEKFLKEKLSEADIEKLHYTHKKLLVKLDNGTIKANIAKKCIDEGWASRELDEEIKKKFRQIKKGRTPTLIQTTRKYIKKVDAVLDTVDDSALNIDETDLQKMSVEKLKDLKKDVSQLKGKIESAFEKSETISTKCDELITQIDATAKERKKNPPKVGRPKKQEE